MYYNVKLDDIPVAPIAPAVAGVMSAFVGAVNADDSESTLCVPSPFNSPVINSGWRRQDGHHIDDRYSEVQITFSPENDCHYNPDKALPYPGWQRQSGFVVFARHVVTVPGIGKMMIAAALDQRRDPDVICVFEYDKTFRQATTSEKFTYHLALSEIARLMERDSKSEYTVSTQYDLEHTGEKIARS
jgi:hypothetical protein